MSIAKTSRIISLLSVILLLFTGYCVYDLRNNIIRQHYVDAERTTLQTLTKELQESSIELTVAARNFAVTGNQAFIDAYNHVVDVRSGKKAREKTKFVAPEETISLLDLSRKNGCTDREMELLNEVMQRSILLAKLEAQAFELGRQGKFDEAKAIMYGDAYEKQRAEVAKPVFEFDEILVSRLLKESQAAASAVRGNLTLVSITIILNILLALFSAFFSNQRIVRRLEICSNYARTLAEGKYDQNLSARYPDELGTMVNALNVMVDSLKARIDEAQKAMEHAKERQGEAEVAMKQAEAAKAQAERAKRDGMLQAANDLSSVVDAVSDVSKALSDGIVRSDNGAKEQAHLALETAGSMEEMKGAVNAVAKSASDAANASAHVKQKAQEGVEQVAQVTESMSELSHAATKISEDIHALGKQADGIGAILSVISDIADQTNLLALNAAIEAARAGEAGRGFAVVADEVRKLAEKTMSATHEVSQAIGSIQESVRENITSVTATGEMAQRVTEIVQHSGQVLDEILHLAEASADQVSAIAAASEEQSASGEHISRSVDTISTIANQTADTMHEADNAVKELLQQAGRLSHLIDEMKRG